MHIIHILLMKEYGVTHVFLFFILDLNYLISYNCITREFKLLPSKKTAPLQNLILKMTCTS